MISSLHSWNLHLKNNRSRSSYTWVMKKNSQNVDFFDCSSNFSAQDVMIIHCIQKKETKEMRCFSSFFSLRSLFCFLSLSVKFQNRMRMHRGKKRKKREKKAQGTSMNFFVFFLWLQRLKKGRRKKIEIRVSLRRSSFCSLQPLSLARSSTLVLFPLH